MAGSGHAPPSPLLNLMQLTYCSHTPPLYVNAIKSACAAGVDAKGPWKFEAEKEVGQRSVCESKQIRFLRVCDAMESGSLPIDPTPLPSTFVPL